MAKVVKQLPPRKGGVGRAPRYPYNKWLDGRVWRLTAGEDFDTRPTSMRKLVHSYARRRHMRVETRVEGEQLYVQATEGGD